MINQYNAFGNSNAYVNAACLFNFANASVNSILTKPWILDSGATDHIISNSTLLIQIKPSLIPTVNLPTGSLAPITSTGTLFF